MTKYHKKKQTVRIDESSRKGKMLKRFTLQKRLLFLFFFLFTVSLLTVGYTSYEKAKAATIKTIENRLGRETEGKEI